MNNDLISVIIPSYNHSAYICQAIDSVINQTYKNWEIIIVDNYSTDNTEEIVNKYKSKRINLYKIKNRD